MHTFNLLPKPLNYILAPLLMVKTSAAECAQFKDSAPIKQIKSKSGLSIDLLQHDTTQQLSTDPLDSSV